MLHAIGKSKTGFYKRYLGKRDDDSEHKVYEEDEITSTLLGPLDFLPMQDVYCFWHSVLELSDHSNFLPSSEPVDIQIVFWERRNASDNGRLIEPDSVVTMKFSDGQVRLLLIELKWRAPLSGEDQLHRQWCQYLNEDERKQALHLFIAPETSAGAAAPNNQNAGGDVWSVGEDAGQSRLVLLPWLKIRAILDKFARSNTKFSHWAELTNQFLQKVGIGNFSGFSHLERTFALPSSNSASLFWSPYMFAGWNAIGQPPSLPTSDHAQIILNNLKGTMQ